MFAKLVVLCAVVAVAYGGVVGVAPASTTLLANHHVVAGPALTLAHAPIARTVVAGPAITYAAAPQAIALSAQPTVIQTGNKIVQTIEPVEQHGYSIAY